jgi:hypothetical protein
MYPWRLKSLYILTLRTCFREKERSGLEGLKSPYYIKFNNKKILFPLISSISLSPKYTLIVIPMVNGYGALLTPPNVISSLRWSLAAPIFHPLSHFLFQISLCKKYQTVLFIVLQTALAASFRAQRILTHHRKVRMETLSFTVFTSAIRRRLDATNLDLGNPGEPRDWIQVRYTGDVGTNSKRRRNPRRPKT